jgi:glyoxylase-like metal-dependent hydrolase (beta-lactamase superfamily II)
MGSNSRNLEAQQTSFKKIPTPDDWFEVREIAENLFVFCEPRHYENTIVNLVVGEEKAALIDTGCGIGNLRSAIEDVTDKPIVVINTHTHADHLGGNYQFDEIAMFDHPLSRRVTESGVSHQILSTDILAENLVSGPWPRDFDRNAFAIPPFRVTHWLREGDAIDLGGRKLQAIYTPGEAQDHICLLDRAERLLFCGDILLRGPVWTHLDGGSLQDLIASYRKLMDCLDDFDHLMPGHNQPWLDKELLPATLMGAQAVFSGQAEFREVVDPWNRKLREYSFDQFEILTCQ